MAFNWDQIGKDFQQKYEHTFIRVKLRDELEVFFVDKVGRGTPPYLELSNSVWGKIQLNYDTEFEINFEHPEVGMFDAIPGIALFLGKRFQRQWKRGISDNTILIQSPYSRYDVYHKRPNVVSEIQIRSAFLPRTTRSLPDAKALLYSGVVSVCLNEFFSLGHEVRDRKGFVLWYLTSPIALVNDNIITVREQVFTQEIRDYLRRTGENNYVVE